MSSYFSKNLSPVGKETSNSLPILELFCMLVVIISIEHNFDGDMIANCARGYSADYKFFFKFSK